MDVITRMGELERRVTDDGVVYEVIQSSSGRAEGKRWVVFSAGVSLNRTCWRPWYPAFVDVFNVASLDVPGYGESQITAERLARREVHDWASNYFSVLNDLQTDSAYLIGEQTGGAALLYCATAKPERVDAGVIIATPYKGTAIRSTISSYSSASEETGIRGWSDFMMPHLLYPTPDHPFAAELRRIHLQNDLDVILHDGDSWQRVDLTDHLSAATMPILVLAPGSSLVVPREHSFDLERRLPNAELILFGSCGQVMAFTDADRLAPLSAAFLRRHADTRPVVTGPVTFAQEGNDGT